MLLQRADLGGEHFHCVLKLGKVADCGGDIVGLRNFVGVARRAFKQKVELVCCVTRRCLGVELHR